MQARITRLNRQYLLHALLQNLNILQQPSLPSIDTVAAEFYQARDLTQLLNC